MSIERFLPMPPECQSLLVKTPRKTGGATKKRKSPQSGPKLRSRGVPIGKRDYEGRLRTRAT